MPSDPKTTIHDGLPNEFSLVVTRKPDGYWRITCPGYPGLYVATNKGLDAALIDVPRVLSDLIRLDGETS